MGLVGATAHCRKGEGAHPVGGYDAQDQRPVGGVERIRAKDKFPHVGEAIKVRIGGCRALVNWDVFFDPPRVGNAIGEGIFRRGDVSAQIEAEGDCVGTGACQFHFDLMGLRLIAAADRGGVAWGVDGAVIDLRGGNPGADGVITAGVGESGARAGGFIQRETLLAAEHEVEEVRGESEAGVELCGSA